MKSKKIKSSCGNKKDIPIIKVSNSKVSERKIIFIFENFSGESIEIKKIFNNYYANQETSVKTVNQFLTKLKELELCDDISSIKHYHPIKTPNEVDKIKKVLSDGYKFNSKKIESFENSYYEIPFGNGQRIICSKVDNLIELLFVDSNHMIYDETSRFLKLKKKFEYPSCLGKISFLKDYDEYYKADFIKMIIEDYENGECQEASKIIENLKYVLYGDEHLTLENESKTKEPV